MYRSVLGVRGAVHNLMKRPVVHVFDGSAMLFAKFMGVKEPYDAARGAVRDILVNVRNVGRLLVAQDCSRSELVRRHIFPGYKANRDGRTSIDFEGLGEAFDEFYGILGELEIRCLRVDGWEADDILASAAAQYDWVKLHTTDKDAHQLISRTVQVISPNTGRVRRKDALKRWGVDRISKIVEVQCLMGDRDDGVPGVKGVGPKRAAELIRTYGTARNVWNHRSELSGKIAEALDAFDVDLGYRLVTLNRELEIPDSKDLVWRRRDVPGIAQDLYL